MAIWSKQPKDWVNESKKLVGWVHPAQATSQTAAMLDAIAEGAILEVPALWPLEVVLGVICAGSLFMLLKQRFG